MAAVLLLTSAPAFAHAGGCWELLHAHNDELNRFSRSLIKHLHLSLDPSVGVARGGAVTCPRQHGGEAGVMWDRWEAALNRQSRQGCPAWGNAGESVQLHEHRLCHLSSGSENESWHVLITNVATTGNGIWQFSSHHCSGPCYAVVFLQLYCKYFFYLKFSIFFKLCLKIQRFLAPSWG